MEVAAQQLIWKGRVQIVCLSQALPAYCSQLKYYLYNICVFNILKSGSGTRVDFSVLEAEGLCLCYRYCHLEDVLSSPTEPAKRGF